MSYTLFDDLTKLTPNGDSEIPSAVQLVDFLLKGVGMDACDSDCNAQAMYRLSVRSKHVANRIIELTDEVLNKADEAAFMEYNKLINPLEDLLFRVAMLPQRDHERHDGIQVGTHEVLLQPYSEWHFDRQQVRLSLRSLHQADFDTTLPADQSDTKDYHEAMTYDDVACLRSAAKELREYQHHDAGKYRVPEDSEVPDLIKEVADKIEELASSLSTAPPQAETPLTDQQKTYDLPDPKAEIAKGNQPAKADDPLYGEAINDADGLPFRAAFVLSGILTRPGEQDKDWEIQRWRTKESWEKATALMKKIVDAVKPVNQQAAAGITQALVDEWKAYELWLLGEIDIMRRSILELMKYVARMQRPYYFRAFALVKGCLELERLTVKDARTQAQYMTFITTAEAALDKASKKLTSVSKFDWATIIGEPAYTDFDDVETKLKDAFTTFGKTTEWAAAKTAIDAAKARDETGVKHLSAGFDAIKARAQRTAQNVKVTVKVCAEPASGASVDDTNSQTFDVDAAERLDAILWKMRAKCSELLKLKPQFYKDDNKTKVKVDRHEKLSIISPGSADITLYLAISDITKWQP